MQSEIFQAFMCSKFDYYGLQLCWITKIKELLHNFLTHKNQLIPHLFSKLV